MSANIIEEILHRAISDRAFAEALLANSEKALAGYNLSTEDLARFKGLSRAEFSSLAIEERKSTAMKMAPGQVYEPPTGRNHNETELTIRH